MPGELVPYPPSSDVVERTAFSPPGWASGPAAPSAPPPARGNRLARYKAALGRYKWVMLPIVLLGTVAGVIATRFIQPDYEAQARVWISAGDDSNNGDTKQGPIRSDEIVHNAAWIELLKSYRISDSVAVKLGLFATPNKARDSVVNTPPLHTPSLVSPSAAASGPAATSSTSTPAADATCSRRAPASRWTAAPSATRSAATSASAGRRRRPFSRDGKASSSRS